MIKKIFYFSIVLFLTCFTRAFALSGTLDASLKAVITEWKQQQNIPALSFSIQKKGQKTPLTFITGTRTLEGKQKVKPSDLFQIGSITKTFISVLLLQLEAEGKLNMNDPIGRWLPEYPRWQAITIKQLLNMTSGIYNYTQALDTRKMSPTEKSRFRPPAELIALAYHEKDYSPPGETWHYSNTNYLLAGLVLERCTGEPLEKLLKERLLDKYQLKNTFYFTQGYPEALRKRLVPGYRDNQDTTQVNLSLFGSAGAMLSNSPDLLKWTRLLFTGQVLPPQQQQEFLEALPFPDAPPKPKSSRYGLGIYATEDPELGTLWWYSGVTSGHIALLVWIPSQETIITANINRWQADHYGVLVPQQAFLDKIFLVLKKNNFWT
jgi:D-alanyl-D-alanine carboxypeptidase